MQSRRSRRCRRCPTRQRRWWNGARDCGEFPQSLRDEVARANERFVSAELTRHSRLFDTVESKPLTAAQRRACVIDDDHNLVLAGAGTGKTSVMIGRAGYLLTAGIARPESMLMVAYNRDAAQELRERVARRLAGVADVERLTIKTFHALGLDLIAEAEGVRPVGVGPGRGQPCARSIRHRAT